MRLQRLPALGGEPGQGRGFSGVGGKLDQRRRIDVLHQAGQRAVTGLRALENARKRVIVALGDRVELVIVAARTGDGQAEKCLAGDVDLLVGQVEHELPAVLHVERLAAEGQEAGGDRELGPVVVVAGGEEVAGDLLFDELVVRLVVVKGGDDPVAVSPGLGIHHVGIAGRFGVPRQVEPVPPPALAEPRRGQKPVDDLREGVIRRIGNEGFDVLG